MPFEFIHCGDLHLGCAPNRLEERFFDFFAAFKQVIDYARDNSVKTILVSGDFFHLKGINAKTLQHTITLLQEAKANKIEVIVIEGNHDKAFFVDEESWLFFLHKQQYITLLQNDIVEGKIKVIPYDGKQGTVLHKEGVRIVGLGYLGGATEKYIKDLKAALEPSEEFTILMLHAAINRMSGQEMGDIRGEVISKTKSFIDYVALGHIHNQYEFDDFCFNPGALENIRLKDAYAKDKKGFYHVKIEGKNKEVIYIQSNPRPIVIATVDIEGAKTPKEAEKRILSHPFDIKENEMLYLRLYGKVAFNQYIINIAHMQTQIIETYKILHMEISNHINATGTNREEIDIIDTKAMVLNLLTENIKFNFPDVKNPEKKASLMHDVADLINDNADIDIIVDNLLKQDVTL